MQSAPLLIFAALFTASSASAAFEVNGLVGGMNGEAALRALRDRSEKVSELGGGNEVERTYLANSRGGAVSEAITICRGRLLTHQYELNGGMRAFVRSVQAEQATAGAGSAEAVSRETSAGEWSQVKFVWRRSKFNKEIAYSYVSSEQVYVRHSMGSGRCE